MLIKILGANCVRCIELENNVRKVISENNIEAEVIKIDDIQQIVSYGVMTIPALVIDEKVVSIGKVLNSKEILEVLNV